MRVSRFLMVLAVVVIAGAARADVLREIVAPQLYPKRVSWSQADEMLWMTDEHQVPVTVGFYDPKTGFVQAFPVPCDGCNDGVTARAYIEDIQAVANGAWFIWTRVAMDGSPLDDGMNNYISYVTRAGLFANYTIPIRNAFKRNAFGGFGEPHFEFAGERVYFTANAIGHLGYFDTKTKMTKDIPLSSANSLPTGIALAPNGNIYAALAGTGKIAKLSLGDDVLTEYALPNSSSGPAVPYDVATMSDGQVVFSDYRQRLGTILPNDTFAFAQLDSSCTPFDLTPGGARELYVACSAGQTGTIGHVTVQSAVNASPFDARIVHVGFPVPPGFGGDLAWTGHDDARLFVAGFQKKGDSFIDSLFDTPARPNCMLWFKDRYRVDHGSLQDVIGSEIEAITGRSLEIVLEPVNGTPPYKFGAKDEGPATFEVDGSSVNVILSDSGRTTAWLTIEDSSSPMCSYGKHVVINAREWKKMPAVRH